MQPTRELKTLKLSEIKPYPNNPRKNDNAVETVAESIKQCGYCAPIAVDENCVILAGHTRLKAIKKLGWKEAEVLVISGLTEEQKKKYRLLDNKTGEVALWDFDALDIELEDMDFEGFDFGFDLPENEPGEVIEDEAPEVDEINPPTAKLGDVWQLGRHRLMCGDSTDAGTVARLMDGKKADMVFTDPPYALFGNSTGVSGITDDKMTRPFFLAIFQRMREVTKQFAHIYTCCDWHSAFSLQAMAKQSGLTEKNLCVWDKGDGGVGAMYQQCYEMVWFFANSPIATTTMGTKKAGERTVNGKPNIWRYKRVTSAERSHSAQKPLGMVEFAVGNSSDKNESVCDLFGGSGTTLIACEQLDRTCYMMELDPKYCDVIIKRWETLTGETAVLQEKSV